MKKDKNWLKEELSKQIDILHTTISSGNYVSLVKRAEIMNLVNQLDEPEITEEQAWKIIAKSTNRPVMFWENMRDNYLSSLKEPELPAIPRFVADYLDDFKKQNLTLGDALDTHLEDDKQIHTWLYEDGEVRNDEVFARAWLDGYTIEKETMYYVILVESEDKEYGQALYKDFNYDGDKVVSTHIETFSKRISLEAGNFHFAEQEMKSIDERYWAFAEEVTE